MAPLARRRIVAVVSRVGDAAQRIDAYDERRSGKQPRFLLERGRPTEIHRLIGRELPEPALDLHVVQRRLVDVEDRNLGDRRLPEHLLGHLDHAAMAVVQGIERPRHEQLRRAVGRTDANRFDLAQQQVLPGGRGLRARLFDLLAFEQIEREPIGHAARFGHDVQQQPSGKPLLFRPAAAVLLQLQMPSCGQGDGLQGDVNAMRAALRPIAGQTGRASRDSPLPLGGGTWRVGNWRLGT